MDEMRDLYGHSMQVYGCRMRRSGSEDSALEGIVGLDMLDAYCIWKGP